MSLACSPFLPSILAMLFDRGLLLTVLCLFCSFCLHPEYNYFRSRLKQFLPFLDGLTPPTNGGSTINAALKVLWTERQREKVMEAGEKEDCDEMGDCARASAADQDENMIDEAGRPLALVGKVDDALKILVHNATEVFGFAPRDVYNGIIDLPETRARHRKRFDCSTLQAIVEMFSYKYELSDFAEHVIVVYPVPRFDNYDDWAIDFKSIRIAREAVESMRSEQDGRLRETYHRFCMIPEGSIMAGWVFEAIIHRMLSYGWRSADGPTPQPIRMASNGCDPPTFSSTRGTSLSSLAPLGAHTRTFIRVDFTEGLSNVKLDSDRYYVPTVTNNPLFDSFTIDLGRRTVVISVFQIATSPRHGGSGKGYTLIRKIMARVGKLLEKAKLDVKIKVVYFLVCPEDESQHQWQMPVNCNKDAGTHDHREDVFCVRVPVRRGTSCLFTPNFATWLNYGWIQVSTRFSPCNPSLHNSMIACSPLSLQARNRPGPQYFASLLARRPRVAHFFLTCSRLLCHHRHRPSGHTLNDCLSNFSVEYHAGSTSRLRLPDSRHEYLCPFHCLRLVTSLVGPRA